MLDGPLWCAAPVNASICLHYGRSDRERAGMCWGFQATYRDGRDVLRTCSTLVQSSQLCRARASKTHRVGSRAILKPGAAAGPLVDCV